MITRRTAIVFTGALGSLTLVGRVMAQGKYPDQPVKFIVALPPGGSVDMENGPVLHHPRRHLVFLSVRRTVSALIVSTISNTTNCSANNVIVQ